MIVKEEMRGEEEDVDDEVVENTVSIKLPKARLTAKLVVWDSNGRVVDIVVTQREEDIARMLADRRLLDS